MIQWKRFGRPITPRGDAFFKGNYRNFEKRFETPIDETRRGDLYEVITEWLASEPIECVKTIELANLLMECDPVWVNTLRSADKSIFRCAVTRNVNSRNNSDLHISTNCNEYNFLTDIIDVEEDDIVMLFKLSATPLVIVVSPEHFVFLMRDITDRYKNNSVPLLFFNSLKDGYNFQYKKNSTHHILLWADRAGWDDEEEHIPF